MGDGNTVSAGRCFCGAVRFEFTGQPKWVIHCHCESCRRAVSSPMTTWLAVPNDRLTWTGSARSYVSSPGALRKFCGNCGAQVSFEHERFPDETHLYVASMDDPGAFRPSRHVFFEERLPWMDVHDDLPRFLKGSGKGARPDLHGPATES
ncbi:GFA family protein [Minwuia sp.]|uniref:GFA family protein n=1 Tax=Minwuia sp. TaxID=2493630 RepID=UPI003A91D34B